MEKCRKIPMLRAEGVRLASPALRVDGSASLPSQASIPGACRDDAWAGKAGIWLMCLWSRAWKTRKMGRNRKGDENSLEWKSKHMQTREDGFWVTVDTWPGEEEPTILSKEDDTFYRKSRERALLLAWSEEVPGNKSDHIPQTRLSAQIKAGVSVHNREKVKAVHLVLEATACSSRFHGILTLLRFLISGFALISTCSRR